MLNVSLVVFVMLQQKKNLILCQVEATICLEEEGAPLARMMTNGSAPLSLFRWNPGRLLGPLAAFWQA